MTATVGNSGSYANEGGFESPPPFDPSLIAAPVYQDDQEEIVESSEEQVDPAEEARQWRERYEALEAASKSETERREALEAEQYRREQQESQARFQQWQKAEQDALAHARTLSRDEAVDYMDRFRRERESALYQWGDGVFNQLQDQRTRAQAEKIAKDEGIAPEEIDTLLRAAAAAKDPRVMKDEAKRIKARSDASNAEVRELRAQIEQMRAEQNRARLASSQVGRVGQGTSRPAAQSQVTPGSVDHFRQLLGDL